MEDQSMFPKNSSTPDNSFLISEEYIDAQVDRILKQKPFDRQKEKLFLIRKVCEDKGVRELILQGMSPQAKDYLAVWNTLIRYEELLLEIIKQVERGGNDG